jgi:hypothetical protein
MDRITLCRLDAPKANAVDYENHVLGHDLKGFISSTTPIDGTQPLKSHSWTPYLSKKGNWSLGLGDTGVWVGVGKAERRAKVSGGAIL